MTLTASTPPVMRTGPTPTGLRRYLPRHLFTRSLIIVIAPMILLQCLVVYLFLADHEARTSAKLTAGTLDQVFLTHDLFKGARDAATRQTILTEASDDGLAVSFLPGATLPTSPGTTDTDVGGHIDRALRSHLAENVWFDDQRAAELVDLRIAEPDGVLRFEVRRKRFHNTNMHILPVWMIGSSIVLITVAVIFLRNQIRPIQRLAAAAEAFGRGRDVPDFRPSGALEVRRAAIAFIGMKQRLARQIQQRTEMLAGVSHDLRTPLTRMKLELAMMDEAETADMRNDVLEMERMLDEYLAFARGEGGEQSTPTDLALLVAEVADDARRKSAVPVETTMTGDLKAEVKRNALKRCIVNLVDNAQKYGAAVHVSALRKSNELIEIIVDDNGPGIPSNRRAEAFKPFRRLDADGRNLTTGGVGLGLAIAKDIARAHGGDVRLADSPQGGLRATIRLPV